MLGGRPVARTAAVAGTAAVAVRGVRRRGDRRRRMIVGIAGMTAGIGAGFAEQRGSGWRLPLHMSDGVSRRPA